MLFNKRNNHFILSVHILFVVSFFITASDAFGQCASPYTTYPVTFNFETSNGGWYSGGNNSDWSWGHPAKPVINGAAGGQNCWITGGLTGSSYNDNESSWLRSPNCFDFSANPNPYIEFKVFWETEQQFDGASFQYSTDDGVTWKNVGAIGDNSVCTNKNWFNGSVTYLTGLTSSKVGWSGNVQPTQGICKGGMGSGAWVTARHNLYFLTGQTHVQFRFIFGSGSTCNGFDGFAVDDIVISNTPPGPTISNVNVTNAKCFGAATGAAVATATNGILPYTYTWTSGANTYSGSSVDNLPAGSYKLVVADNNNCTNTYQFAVTQPPALGHTSNVADATCGLNNGSAAFTETGGTSPYTYLWSPNVSTGATASSLAPGSYDLTVTDNNNCTDLIHFDIINKGGVTASISNSTDVKCYGTNTGSATVTAVGTGPFTYFWLPSGGTDATADNLPAGTYKVLVTDPSGCSKEPSVVISQPNQLIATATKQDATCNVNNGKAGVSVTGGTSPYTYLWTPGNYTAANVTGLAPASYTVTITDAAGCTTSEQVTIGSSAPPQLAAITHADVLCYGQTSGSAEATVSGGTAPYNYTWSNGNNTYTGNPLTNVSSGTYQLAVTDANGCNTSGNVTINQPLALVHSVGETPVSCSNPAGSAEISETGGTGPYTYSWSPSGGTNASASGLSAGDYVVLIKDNNQCTDSAHIHILNTSAVTATIIDVKNVSCKGGNNGSATAGGSGGAGTFAYSWSPSGGNAAVADNLAAGIYKVLVTDQNGCSAQATVEVTEPDLLTVQISSVNTTCGQSNGSATATATGGTSPYTFTWSVGSATTAAVSSLAAAAYTVTVADANGCSAIASVSIGGSSSPVIAPVTHSDALCNNQSTGSATAAVTSGTAPYTFEWKNTTGSYAGNPLQNAVAGIYNLTVTDAAGCLAKSTATIGEPAPLAHTVNTTNSTCGNPNGSAMVTLTGGTSPYNYSWSPTGGSSNSATGLAAGNYVVTIQDSHQCTDTAHVEIVNAGGVSVSIVNVKNVTCFGGNNGSAMAKVLGSAPPYSYAWSPSGGNNADAGNLVAGDYKVVVKDQQGCSQSATATVRQRKAVEISIGTDTVICPGRSLVLDPGNFSSYTWQDNTTDSTYKVTQSGSYSVVVVDSIGCRASASVNVEVNCRDLLFPTAFTPNGDLLNDEFGPLGTLSAVKDYVCRIYDRWGQLVFYTNDPGRKWRGVLKSSPASTGTFVWVAQYSFNGQPKKVQKGTILLIR